jgi:hypothetical protein
MINDIIQLLGIASPQLSLSWTFDPAAALGYDNAFTLNCASGNVFVAPCNGILNTNVGRERITMPDGTIPASAVILKIDPQVYLRLIRMYASQIEGQGAANTSAAERPVPCYFVYTNLPPNTKPDDGLVLAGDSLKLYGDMTIHDEHGFPIDPLAVADAFNVFVQGHDTMIKKQLNSVAAPPTPAPQLSSIATLGGKLTTIHLLSSNGSPYTTGDTDFANVKLTNNLNSQNSQRGLYSISNVAQAITKTAATAFVKIGAATNGTMADSYTIRPLANGLTLNRDFLRVYVTNIQTHLIGVATAALDPATSNGVGPVICDNEQVTLLVNGNECLSIVGSITAPARPLTLVVSPVIDNDFILPPPPPTPPVQGTGNERWPAFPVPAPTANGSATPIPPNIKNNIAITARFIADQATNNADVLVKLSCPSFTPGDSLRIYNRLFNTVNGTESRGPGAGAIIVTDTNGGNSAFFRLKDPFGQINGIGVFSPVNSPKLMLDVVLVNRGMFKRTFGNIQCPAFQATAPLNTSSETPFLVPAGNPVNNLNQMAERGISPAGISGTSSTAIKGTATVGSTILDEVGENQPRNAPRYPTMARYDSMAAALTGTTWNAFCGGTLFSKEALNNFPLMGNPGSPGGVEYSSVGVQTQGGMLAYEIARAAYRRTRNVFERMVNLMATNAVNWNPPTTPGPVANTWVAATLQNIAAHCETPELGLVYNTIPLPATLQIFTQQLQAATIGTPLPAWIPGPLQPRLQVAINGLGSNPQYGRGYNELMRELSSSLYGRQDSYWSLLNALGNARECIYIQGSFLNHTSYAGDSWVGNDILEMLKDLIEKSPRLKVIICMGKQIQYGKGYESFEAREYKMRKEAVEYLQGTPDTDTNLRPFANRVIAFHPNGFPMRPKVLQHQVVIVDDMWALVGSSTLRRRGLQFDGSQDVVLFDKNIVNGKSAGIRNFRIKLLQEHLNLELPGSLTPGLLVRMNDLNDCFYAIKELLEGGGAGVISPIQDGDYTDIIFPTDDVADPGSNTFSINNGLAALLATLSTTPA